MNEKKCYSWISPKIATTYTVVLIEVNWYKLFWAIALSLILQYSQNWLVSNEPQEHVKHETDRILTQQ